MTAYYNENNPFAAQWLRNLIIAGHIAPGDVDERSIRDVHPADILGYTQCHFFAGIGVWSYALRQAGWANDKQVWTGSCPCQPFSVAGKRKGITDDRHLWPDFYRLIAAHRPVTIFGEQVASRDGLAWLDFVSTDLEAAGYAVGAVDTCAAGFGAPHIRQRLYFVADSASSPSAGINRVLATNSGGKSDERAKPTHGGATDGVGDSKLHGSSAEREPSRAQDERRMFQSQGSGAANGFWRDAEWLPCIDGKARAVEPGTFPLAHGASARVGRLHAYGNCIVPQAAEAFIRSFMEVRP